MLYLCRQKPVLIKALGFLLSQERRILVEVKHNVLMGYAKSLLL
jgi:hypothetical protein